MGCMGYMGISILVLKGYMGYTSIALIFSKTERLYGTDQKKQKTERLSLLLPNTFQSLIQGSRPRLGGYIMPHEAPCIGFDPKDLNAPPPSPPRWTSVCDRKRYH